VSEERAVTHLEKSAHFLMDTVELKDEEERSSMGIPDLRISNE
jgi:hypothetical protein